MDKILKHIFVHTAVASPYRHHLFALIAGSFERATFFIHEKDIEDRSWRFDEDEWGLDIRHGSGRRFPVKSSRWSISLTILHILLKSPRGSIHLVWMGAPFWDLMLFAFFGLIRHVNVVLWNDGAFKEIISTRAKRRYHYLSKWCYRGVFAAGRIGQEYCLALGFRLDQIVNSFFSHDVKMFGTFRKVNYACARRDVRQELGIEGSSVAILNVSRYLSWKRLVDLAQALGYLEINYPAIAEKCDLILVGDGEYCAHLPILNKLKHVRVHLVHQMLPEELLSYYCAADFMAFPSEGDIWGLVVNEALSMGVPVICTDRIGASELVKDGENGFVIPVRSPEMLGERIKRLVENEALRKTMSVNAMSVIQEWNSEKGVKGLCRFVETSCM